MKNNKKLNFKKLILFILIIILCIYSLFKFNSKIQIITQNFHTVSSTKNSSYSGIGQEYVSNKDGYFSTFTTIDEHKKIYIEYKQNGNASWANNSYWGGTMWENGCGITCLSIIVSGYGGNVTPEDLRKKYYPVLDGEDFSYVLKTSYNIDNTGFLYDTTYFSNDYILNWLKSNRPVLVCVWNKPNNNRWTTASHYMVLLACDDNNKVYVSNPNGGKHDSKSSGWYDIDEITPYIAKVLFINDY